MSSFLSSLPHQIPFRAASSAEFLDERTIRGTFLCSSADALGLDSQELMLVEAMAQVGGMLVFRGSSIPGLLVAIDDLEVTRPPVVGDRVELLVRLEGSIGSLFRLNAEARLDGKIIAKARVALAAAEGPPTGEDR